MLLRYYQRILDTCEPYLVARPGVLAALSRGPFGIEIRDDHVFSPFRVGDGEFLNLIKHLDEIAYAPRGLPMPSWVFYDCGVMPGAIFGFARRAAALDPWARRALAVRPGYDGLVPMSIFLAIPMAHRTATLGYSLTSVNEVAPGAAPEGLWRLTLAVGAMALGIRDLVGTCQWRSPRLGLYAGLGPLELITAWTPAHDKPATATFRVRTATHAIERLLRGDAMGPEGIHRYLDADDYEAMRALQAEIEAGAHIAVAGAAEIRGAETRVPLQVREARGDFEVESGVGFTRRFQG